MELLRGLQPFNLDSPSKISSASWKGHSEEGTVVVRANELLTGILDKSQFGASAYGLVHVSITISCRIPADLPCEIYVFISMFQATYELYGGKKAGELLSALGRLFTFYLNKIAFTCGIDDMLINVRFFDHLTIGLGTHSS